MLSATMHMAFLRLRRPGHCCKPCGAAWGPPAVIWERRDGGAGISGSLRQSTNGFLLSRLWKLNSSPYMRFIYSRGLHWCRKSNDLPQEGQSVPIAEFGIKKHKTTQIHVLGVLLRNQVPLLKSLRVCLRSFTFLLCVTGMTSPTLLSHGVFRGSSRNEHRSALSMWLSVHMWILTVNCYYWDFQRLKTVAGSARPQTSWRLTPHTWQAGSHTHSLSAKGSSEQS